MLLLQSFILGSRDSRQLAMASLMALQGFFHAVALRVAYGKGRAVHNVAALFSFLKAPPAGARQERWRSPLDAAGGQRIAAIRKL